MFTIDTPDASPIHAEDTAFKAENLALNAPVYGTLATAATDKPKPQIVAKAAVDSVARAREYLDGDWLPVPLKPGTDQVNCDGWSELQLTEETLTDYFEDHSNIGVEMGRRSGGLTCLHLCTDDATVAGEYLAPQTGSRFSLESERHSSRLLYTTRLTEAENAPRAISYVDPTDNKPLVEIIIGGAAEPAYVAFPPSVVDQGHLQWDAREHETWAVSEAPDESLKDSARFIALVSILAKHWHNATKAHSSVSEIKIARALGGFLHHAGIARPDALRVLSCLVAATASGAPGESRNFRDCVGPHDNYHIPNMDQAALKWLRYQSASMGPYLFLGGVFGNPIICAIQSWFGYDPHRSQAVAEEQPTKPLAFVNYSDWDESPIPKREWAVEGIIPLSQPYLFTGNGAVGKSLVELMRLVAHVLGRPWLGLPVTQGPAIYLGCEDDADELHRRLANILSFYGASFADLAKGGLHLLSYVGQDCLLASFDRNGAIQPTPLWKRLDEAAMMIRPVAISIDTVADAFGGNEIDRNQVTAFVKMLQATAQQARCSVGILAHPSVAGMNTGTGLSGSTAWHNKVRARCYMKAPETEKGAEIDSDLREIQFMKNNYGPPHTAIQVRWKDGVFVPVVAPSGLELVAQDQRDDELFLDLLNRFRTRGEKVTNKKTANNYAVKAFLGERSVIASKVTKARLESAMLRLLEARKIHIEEYGPASKLRTQLVAGGAPSATTTDQKGTASDPTTSTQILLAMKEEEASLNGQRKGDALF